MGKTRKRVTLLVLSLESIGLLMLLMALYLAGEMRLSCEKSPGSPTVVTCKATEKRFIGLITLQNRRYDQVLSAASEPPALGRHDYWLSLNTPEGVGRILAGSRSRTEKQVAEVNAWLKSPSRSPLIFRRSAAPWAMGMAIFGCFWIILISLIMREFLGYHTPWWLRALGKK